MRISYWTETAKEAGRETLDAARRRWQHALAILAGLLIAAIAILFIAGGYLRKDLIVAVALFIAVAILFGSLFFWKLISIPPRRHAAQMKEISRLRSEVERARSDARPPR